MKITKSDPILVTSPQESIPLEKETGEETFLGKNKWWILLGLVAAGGAAAALSGGGDSSNDSNTSNNGGGGGGDTGNVTVSWE